jgi:hypothetical protein
MLGQISTNELPVSFSLDMEIDLSDEKSLIIMPYLDMEKINREDMEREDTNLPYRFGYEHKVDVNLTNSGKWTSLSNGDKIWNLEIYCPEALTVSLIYDRFWLPEETKFFIYSSDKKNSIGAFTTYNNKGSFEDPRGFATSIIYGDRITLEYYVPNMVKEPGIISINCVVHGYRTFGASDLRDPDVNINCEEGLNWQNEKNAVAAIIIGGYFWGAGFLLNNTANDNKPLFLVDLYSLDMNCIGIDNPNEELERYQFYWNYESQTCQPTFIPDTTHKTTTGANLIAANGNLDFGLLELKEDPKKNPNIDLYYLGWDRTGNPGIGGVVIYHNANNKYIKKIATYNVTPLTSSFPPLSFYGWCKTHFNIECQNIWYISNWLFTPNGYSIPIDASASPLINNQRKVIGHFARACPFPEYSKFSQSWDLGSYPKERLKEWLDPLGTNVTILDGIHRCYDTFANITVQNDRNIIGCNDLNVENVVITNAANLTLEAPGSIIIEGNFIVNSDSKLIIK